jgi:ABC-type multidrug transport system fused ATPase/permease subunit
MNPPPTLDPQVEALIRQSIEKLLAGRTVLLIAHRLNTVFDADRIIVMAEGKISEQGTHQVLLRQDGLYRKLIRAYEG